jgi:hypothetical protein
MNNSPPRKTRVTLVLAALVALGLVIWAAQPRRLAVPAKASAPDSAAVGTTKPAGLLPAEDFPWFRSHPFKVAHSNADYGWTAEDGRDTNVMRRLAHNEGEYRRMRIENDAIFRRQLIYFTQGFAPLAQQAMQTGQGLKQITLPGLDGQEFSVDVTRTDFRNGGSQGQIYGQLPGQPGSMVTVAFLNMREAFTVISPQNHIYLQAEAREPGEVVVKSINPALYGILKPQNN